MEEATQEIMKLIYEANSLRFRIQESQAHHAKLIQRASRRSWEREISLQKTKLGKLLDELELALQQRRVMQSKKPPVLRVVA